MEAGPWEGTGSAGNTESKVAMGWHYGGVGTDICYAWEPQPSESSGPRAKGGRQGSGHLSRGWDTELTSELSLGLPFRASKALLGLWVVLGGPGSPRHRLLDQLL